jgi:hypothetical protein
VEVSRERDMRTGNALAEPVTTGEEASVDNRPA